MVGKKEVKAEEVHERSSKDENLEINEEKEISKPDNKNKLIPWRKNSNVAQKITKTISNMLFSGIVTQKEGINFMWDNPFIFVPSEPFVTFYKILRDGMGSKINELFYWLGVLQGRNSTVMMKNRFGLDEKDLDSFIDGASIIGMGTLTLKEVDENYNEGIIKGENSNFAVKLRKLVPKNREVVDFYLSGILAGGCEVLVNKNCICVEDSCMGRGDESCIYHLKLGTASPLSFLKMGADKLKRIEETLTKKYTNKKVFFKMSVRNIFSFNNGSFFLNNIEGYNLESFLFVLIDEILKEDFKKNYEKALDKMFIKSFEIISLGKNQPLNNLNLKKNLELCRIFGYGNICIKDAPKKNTIFIEIANSSFASEYLSLFGLAKTPIDNITSRFLKNIFLYAFNKKCVVEEVSCVGKGDRTCLFKISL